MSNKNSPLDFLLLENHNNNLLFNDNDTNEVMLPDDMPISEELPKENLEPSTEPRDIISELLRKISDLKEEITSKLKPLFPEEGDKTKAEALDDATSALDSVLHHLEDVDNDLSGNNNEELGLETTPEISSDEPVRELEDDLNV